jgi:hypothetical protein
MKKNLYDNLAGWVGLTSFVKSNYIKKLTTVIFPWLYLKKGIIADQKNSLKPVLREVPTFWEHQISSLGVWLKECRKATCF